MSTRFRPTLGQYRKLEDAHNRAVHRQRGAEEAFIQERTERRNLEQQLQAEIEARSKNIMERDNAKRWVNGLTLLSFTLWVALCVVLIV